MNLLGVRNQKLTRVKVTTMDADLNSIVIESNWTGRQLFDTVCRIIGLREIWYFGLRYMNKKELPSWLQMDKKICNQDVPKQSDGSTHFLFLVKFYPETVEEELIQDITRHLFFLQIKQSILSMDLYCQPEAAVLLASYAVQALYGDYPGTPPSYLTETNVDDLNVDDNILGVELDLSRLLPQSVIDQYDMSAEMWEERIRKWWANNNGLSTEDAEIEYLRVAQDLDMYGIQYYSIFNQKDTDLLLGVSAQGIGIYEISNRLSPRPFFPWTEIKNISFQNKLFVICVTDNSKIKFRAQDCSINASILDLCIGTHNLYLRRRQPDLLEIQQMKIQAKEQRQKRITEQNRLLRERELRQQAEVERDRYSAELIILKEQLAAMQNMMKNTEESHKLIAEKARVSEKEALELSKRANEAEAEVQRAKLSQMQAEETKMLLERKVRDAELMTQRLVRDVKEKRFCYNHFNQNYKCVHKEGEQSNGVLANNGGGDINSFVSLEAVRLHGVPSSIASSEKDYQRRGHYFSQQMLCDNRNICNGQMSRLVNFGISNGERNRHVSISRHHSYGELHHLPPSSSQSQIVIADATKNGLTVVLNEAISYNSLANSLKSTTTTDHIISDSVKSNGSVTMPDTPQLSSAAPPEPVTLYSGGFRRELKHLYAEIEKSRKEYYQRNRNLKERLMDFRMEIEMLKRENRQSEHDRIYTSNLQSGIDKYSTLRKSGAGSSKSRVKVFDGL